jgi:hypothetical protein
MKLAPSAGANYTLRSQLSSEVDAELPLVTPWRVVMVAPSPGKLLENNEDFYWYLQRDSGRNSDATHARSSPICTSSVKSGDKATLLLATLLHRSSGPAR